jgi:hypothetical protein
MIVTAVPTPPEAGETLLTIVVVPAITATLSNVVVSSVPPVLLLTASPM